MSFKNTMENIKIENTSQSQFLKSQVDFWTKSLDKHNQSLLINPDSYFVKSLQYQASQMLAVSIKNFNEFNFKYGILD